MGIYSRQGLRYGEQPAPAEPAQPAASAVHSLADAEPAPPSPHPPIHWAELSTALVLVVLGLSVAGASWFYGIGSLSRMQTGFFPLLLGTLLAAIGALLCVEVYRAQHAAEPFPLRPALCVSAGVLCFALAVERLGLVPAVLALVVCSVVARPGFRVRDILLIGLSMSLFSWLVFIVGFGLPLAAVEGF